MMTAGSVIATLAGRKSVSRRVLTARHVDNIHEWHFIRYQDGYKDGVRRAVFDDCDDEGPYGAPLPFAEGDAAWIRETWVKLLAVSPLDGLPLALTSGERLIEPPTKWADAKGEEHWSYDGTVIAYKATSDIEFCDGDGFSGDMANKDDMPRWKSGRFLPKEYARTERLIMREHERVERLQDITDAEVVAEGLGPMRIHMPGAGRTGRGPLIDAFAAEWDALNAKRGFGWDTNPWVRRLAWHPLGGGK